MSCTVYLKNTRIEEFIDWMIGHAGEYGLFSYSDQGLDLYLKPREEARQIIIRMTIFEHFEPEEFLTKENLGEPVFAPIDVGWFKPFKVESGIKVELIWTDFSEQLVGYWKLLFSDMAQDWPSAADALMADFQGVTGQSLKHVVSQTAGNGQDELAADDRQSKENNEVLAMELISEELTGPEWRNRLKRYEKFTVNLGATDLAKCLNEGFLRKPDINTWVSPKPLTDGYLHISYELWPAEISPNTAVVDLLTTQSGPGATIIQPEIILNGWDEAAADAHIQELTQAVQSAVSNQGEQIQAGSATLPDRLSDRRKWRQVWNKIREYVEQGWNANEIAKKIELHPKDYENLPTSAKTLRDIIRAGNAGLLENSP